MAKIHGELQLPKWPRLPGSGIIRRQKERESFIVAVFSLFGAFAAAGGKSVRIYGDAPRMLAEKALHLSREEEVLALDAFHVSSRRNVEVEGAAKKVIERCSGDRKLLLASVESVYFLVLFTTEFDPKTADLAARIGQMLHVPEELLVGIKAKVDQQRLKRDDVEKERESAERAAQQRLKARVKEQTATALDRAFATLGVSPNDTVEQVRAKYKELVYEFHPDRARARGESDAKIEEHRQRFQSIVRSYQEVRKTMKF